MSKKFVGIVFFVLFLLSFNLFPQGNFKTTFNLQLQSAEGSSIESQQNTSAQEFDKASDIMQSASHDNRVSFSHYLFNGYTLSVWLIIIAIGVVLGFQQKITIFRDFDDLGLAFLTLLAPLILIKIIFIIIGQNGGKFFLFLFLFLESILILWLAARTFQDNNRSILAFLVAFVTKFSLSILFIFNLIGFVTPTGKTASERAKSRASAFTILLIVTPLIYKLVRNKKGILNPFGILERRGIGL
ncbi:MAG: hypothetical protein M0Z61_10200 [Nitrospiraceae bacterium]|nr:hypothetical protein [Nitrospiraceae bacterium]